MSTEQQIAEKHLIFKCLAGSHAYGMASEHSDIDHRGIFIAPIEYTIGFLKSVEQVEVPGEDTVIYELKKFVRLAVEVNPNIIELLFTPNENILVSSPAFERLRAHRYLFLSKKARHTFSGYAMTQLKRIKGHNKWIEQPQPENPPELVDFAQTIHTSGRIAKGIDFDHDNIFLVKVNATTFRIFTCEQFHRPPISEDRKNIQYIDIEEERIPDNAIFLGTCIVQIEAFRTQHRIWKNYWKWKRERNPARSALEERHGFDTKHASHLVRLMNMCKEILRDGEVIVRRPDAEELIAIRNGKFNYDELIAWAENMENELDVLYESLSLPYSVDMEAINQLYIDIVQEYWEEYGLG